MRARHLLSIHDLGLDEVGEIFDLAQELKERQRRREPHRRLEGKTLAMIFEKPSTRTRVSFEVGMAQLGGRALVLNAADTQLGRGETLHDTAKVLSRYVDGIMARTFAHETVLELARHGSVPVINGLTDLLHPCQVLADLFTIRERFGRLEGLVIAYVGDGNNMANSYLHGAAKVGAELRVATPEGYRPDPGVFRAAETDARTSGGRVAVMTDPAAAVAGAHVVCTDTWASMGQEAEHEARKKVFAPYQLNAALLARARSEAIVLHCLPAHRGEEITDEVMDGPQSAVFDEAENRLHVQKAILALLLRE
ncbi:MAG: ornithine carbamoyltransferase [Planctomycetes bacterium]|nr:ornithine carbamoyltransferase [Planctomycetota bacterium]